MVLRYGLLRNEMLFIAATGMTRALWPERRKALVEQFADICGTRGTVGYPQDNGYA